MFNTKRTTSALTLATLGITQGRADSDIWTNYTYSCALFAFDSSYDNDYACIFKGNWDCSTALYEYNDAAHDRLLWYNGGVYEGKVHGATTGKDNCTAVA